MANPVHIINNIERRTYIKGRMRAKYIGFLDEKNSDKSRINIYDLEILEAVVEINENDIRKWQNGGIFEEFIYLDIFPSKLPADTDYCLVSNKGEKRHFKLNLFDLKIKDAVISDRIVEEEERVFGTLTGEICGYFLHYDPDTRIVLVEDQEDEVGIGSNLAPLEMKGNSLKSSASSLSLVEVIQALSKGLSAILGLLVIAPAILYSLPLIAFAGILYGISLLSTVVPNAIRRIANIFNTLLLLAFILLLLTGIVSYVDQGNIIPEPRAVDQDIEKSNISPLPTVDSLHDSDVSSTSPLQSSDTLILHYRVWRGYNGERYSGYLGVKTSDLRASTQYRNQVDQPVISNTDFNAIFGGMDQFDRAKLGILYSLFDSLGQTYKMDRMQFAEMIVSCIQDIPYTLILEQECNPWQYQDAFIRDYLKSGGRCRPFVKYGILSPVEFIATLEGDCDTRALLLYSVLKNYKYEVAIMVSNHYQHAVLGINLPYQGLSKTIGGKRYIIWETTAEGARPGEFPRHISNMDLWIPALTSNQ